MITSNLGDNVLTGDNDLKFLCWKSGRQMQTNPDSETEFFKTFTAPSVFASTTHTLGTRVGLAS